MRTETIELYSGMPHRTPTLRDIASVCFRHRQLIVVTFCAIFLGSLWHVLFTPRTYKAETEILVERERAYPVVTPQNNATQLFSEEISEEDLNSEVELLKSRDLLEKVVIACGLARQPDHSVLRNLVHRFWRKQDDAVLAVPLAVQAFEKGLKVEAIKKTNLVKVTYESPDPKLAADVLKTLTTLYLEKHVQVHRPPGTFAFFEQETAQYWDGLQAAERNLVNFNRAQNTVSAQAEKSATQQKLADFEATLRQTRTAMAATKGRIQMLTAQMTSTPTRMTTEIRTKSLLLQELKSTLFTLETKRTAMAGKYAASYLPLRELEAQLAETREAIAKEESVPLHEDITNPNPTYQWMSDELAKARTDLASLERQAAETEQQIRAYRSELLVLDGKDLEQQDLVRATKIQETNYLRYQNKREEARISDALDQKHIVNVAVAEAATTPALPSGLSRSVLLLIGFVWAALVSFGAAFITDYFSASLRNSDDVRVLLELPVLASFPKELKAPDPRS